MALLSDVPTRNRSARIKGAARQSNQVRYFQRKISESLAPLGLHIVDLDGERYQEGMAATALNAADFGPDEVLYVEHMMEPIIMGPDGIRRTGTMTLRK